MDDLPNHTDIEVQLRRYADHVEDQVGPIPPFGATRRPTSSRRWPIYAAAVFLLVVGLGVATWLTADDESGDPADDADVIIGEDDEPDPAPDPEPTDDVRPQPTVVDGAWQGEWVRVPATLAQAEPLPHVVRFDDGAFILSSENRGEEMVLEIYDAETDSVRRAADGRHVWRHDPAVVWTGDELVVLAGSNGPGIDDPAIAYDPVEDSWRTLAPPPIDQFGGVDSVWTGDEILLPELSVAYDPAADSWRAMAPQPLPERFHAAHVWAGSEMLVWGGCRGVQCDENPATGVGDGLAYDPVSDSWRELPEAPIAGGSDAVAVWTGEVAVFFAGGAPTGAGEHFATYDPATDGWDVVPGSPFGPARLSSAVWTGESAVFWGGLDGSTARLGGAAFDPTSGRWSVIPDAPFGGRLRTAAWVDGALLVAGDGTYLLRFEPNSDTESALVSVPAVTDLFADTAIQTLRDAGLDVATIFEQVEAGSRSVGRVIAQSPAPFEQAVAGTVVTITVGESAGVAPTTTVDGEPSPDPAAAPISDVAASRAVDGFLSALAIGEWNLAGRYMDNGGSAPDALLDLGLVEGEDWGPLIADYCAGALCGADHEIVGIDRNGVSVVVQVEMRSAAGPVVAPFGVSRSQGFVAVNALPPEGVVGDPLPTTRERLFGDIELGAELVIGRPRLIEWTEGGHPNRTDPAVGRLVGLVDVVDGDVIVYPGFVLDGARVRAVSPWGFAGAAKLDGSTVVFGHDPARGLVAYDTGNPPGDPVVVFPDDDASGSTYSASVGDEFIAATVGNLDGGWVEIAPWNGGFVAGPPTEVRFDGLSIGRVALAPDDSSFVVPVGPDIHTPFGWFVNVGVDGDERGRWDLPTGEVFTGALDFDGRWIVAGLESGRVFVIDTVGDSARVVDVYADVLFD